VKLLLSRAPGAVSHAEEVLARTGWLPAPLRTARAAQEGPESLQADAVTEPKDTEAYSVAEYGRAGTADAVSALSRDHRKLRPRALWARGIYRIQKRIE
jgi:hypothetical protein